MNETLSTSALRSDRLEHVAALDGLRGIAVLLVLWWHLPEQLFGSLNQGLRFVLQPGYLGVDIFFVLSGFLITRILLNEKARRVPVSGFLIRRIARIFPAYYLLLLLVAAVAPDTAGLGWSFVYLSNFYFAFDAEFSNLRHTWSLAVEEHFYLAWPWLVAGLTVARSRILVARFIIPSAAALAVLTAYLEPAFGYEADALIYRITWYRMMSLGVGALLAYHEAALKGVPRTVLLWSIGLAVCGAALLPVALVIDHRWIGPIMLIGFCCVSVSTVMAALWADWSASTWSVLVRNRVFAFVGRISYGLYLYHFPIFALFGIAYGLPEAEKAGWMRCMAAVMVSMLVAWLSFTYFEKPIQDAVRRRLSTSSPPLQDSAAA